MNRRQLFLSTAKAALLTALGGLGLTSGAKAQPAPEAGATAGLARRQLNGLIGKITGTPGTPTATLNIPGDVLPPPPQPFGGAIELNAAQSKPYWPMRVVPPKDAPDHDRRCRLRRPINLRRRDPDPDVGSRCGQWPAVHELSFDRVVLADPRRAHHRQEPPFRRFRRCLRTVDGLPRVQ
jgi:hypothetical protein